MRIKIVLGKSEVYQMVLPPVFPNVIGMNDVAALWAQH